MATRKPPKKSPKTIPEPAKPAPKFTKDRLGPWVIILILAVLYIWDTPVVDSTKPADNASAPAFHAYPLVIVSSGKEHHFQVEVADTDEERAKGFMGREHLSEFNGMLFDFGAPEPAYMWMKNTPIPLDMLFIGSDGVIVKIATAEPYSEQIIPSDSDVRGVLEIAGGRAQELNLTTGDRVYFTAFPQTELMQPEELPEAPVVHEPAQH